MPEHIKLFQVDAFTDKPFAGNPAAVCIMPRPAEEAWMQDVAREMNLSETAFIYRQDDEVYRLRWFTPAVEIELCGHATLATAHVLWEAGYMWENEEIRFQTLSGLLTAQRSEDWIELNFPATSVQKEGSQSGAAAEMIAALGVQPVFVGKTKFDYLVEVASEKEVRAAAPDFAALRAAPVRGVMVTSRSDSAEYDFVSRFFAPASGIAEDPVTGSAHCALAPYWSEKLGKTEFVAYQASARGGVMRVRLEGERALLGGKAVTVFRGEFA